ncbi:MAG TPA: isopentenyl-diphosphate delta-isomerase [Prolixibacteraceae bacterium]|nr:isopentenyl-diphosphate delta-isomerase [Prolixibacteraceae bacterium]HPR60319.1 isopentenyl-diphosphate delta-isomerase [Prolixibacteraceae bacterium]
MEQRKTDHIQLAALSVPATVGADDRFYYEPMLSAHPEKKTAFSFLGQKMDFPLWISSMTGGSAEANRINHILAEACADFGLGMGLGSCRTLLDSDRYLDDFDLRSIIGNELPLYANLGIAQIEKLIDNKQTDKVHFLVDKLKADGLFIHVNPTQEWLQPEGDMLSRPAFETIAAFAELLGGKYKLIVKEVGQGIGPESLKMLMQLPIDGIEFAAFGGTNFANIEIMRNAGGHAQYMYPLSMFGHSVNEMIDFANNLHKDAANKNLQLIVSGGIKNFLDGYYGVAKSLFPAVYGMAGVILQHAMVSKADLYDFLKAETEGYRYASSFLKIRK